MQKVQDKQAFARQNAQGFPQTMQGTLSVTSLLERNRNTQKDYYSNKIKKL